jgi:hypothetical protein
MNTTPVVAEPRHHLAARLRRCVTDAEWSLRQVMGLYEAATTDADRARWLHVADAERRAIARAQAELFAHR